MKQKYKLLDYFIDSGLDIISFIQLYEGKHYEIEDCCIIKFKSDKSYKELLDMIAETDCELVRLEKKRDFWIMTLDYVSAEHKIEEVVSKSQKRRIKIMKSKK